MTSPSISWSRALAWRMRRQLLDPPGDATAAAVVRRLGAIPATPEASAELAVGSRRTQHQPGDVAQALADGELIKTYAFRGATHLMTPAEGSSYLALRTSSRMWERKTWVEFYDLTPDDWPDLRACVREALADGPLTRRELAEALSQTSRFGHLADPVVNGNDTLIKPMAWQGDLCFGPDRDRQGTFRSLAAVPGWTGLPDLDEAGRHAIEHYVRTYGPATPDHLKYWLAQGLGVRSRRIATWLAELDDRLVEVDVAGEAGLVHRDDLDDLVATAETGAVRLLPSYDQWVLGPGTADPHVVPPTHRPLVSGGAALVVSGGSLVGTWTQRGEVAVTLFPDAEPPDVELLEAEVARVSAMLSLG